MLEETAGTSLYNEKKRDAQRTIEKKEEKLKQVQDLIEGEIRPQMDKLLKEKNMFLIWRTQETEKNRLRQQVHSYEYYKKH
jgi:structural maintenance of chromosome 2